VDANTPPIQCIKNHNRMMIGIGTPSNQRIKLRPMTSS
jgi:hypothetical protein